MQRSTRRLKAWINYLREPHRVALVAAISGGFVVGFAFQASRFGDPWIHGIVAWMKDWQTLLTGIGAIGAAWLATRPVFAQLDEARRQSATMIVPTLRARAQEVMDEHSRVKNIVILTANVYDDVVGRIWELPYTLDAGVGIWVDHIDQIHDILKAIDMRDPESTTCPGSRISIIASCTIIKVKLGTIHIDINQATMVNDLRALLGIDSEEVVFDRNTITNQIGVDLALLLDGLRAYQFFLERLHLDLWSQVRRSELLARGKEHLA